MSYLNIDNLDGFNKAVISFWFKVPQKSIDKAKAKYDPNADPPPPFNGIVPLVIFGQDGKGDNKTKPPETQDNVYTGTSPSGTACFSGVSNISAECTAVALPPDICCTESLIIFDYSCNCTSGGGDAMYNGKTQTTAVDGPQPPKEPSFIGIDKDSKLVVNFESAKVPKLENYGTEVNSITPGQGSSGSQLGDCITGSKAFGCDVLCCLCLFIECKNDSDNGNGYDHTETESSASGPSDPGTEPVKNRSNTPGVLDGTSAIRSDVIDCPGDKWHHVLISVELLPIISHGVGHGESAEGPVGDYIDSAAKLFIALDDKNYIKDELSDDWAEGKGDNDVVSDGAYEVAGEQAGEDEPPPKYTLEDSSVPGGPLGIPGTTKYVDNIYDVQMAEFLMWTGQTLDTSEEANRRHFITKVERDGYQHPTNPAPIWLPMLKLAVGDPPTWDPGADWPAFVPPLVDSSVWPTAVRDLGGKADIDFSRCQYNWMKGLNLGTLGSDNVTKTGKIKALVPPKDESPRVQPGGGGSSGGDSGGGGGGGGNGGGG